MFPATWMLVGWSEEGVWMGCDGGGEGGTDYADILVLEEDGVVGLGD